MMPRIVTLVVLLFFTFISACTPNVVTTAPIDAAATPTQVTAATSTEAVKSAAVEHAGYSSGAPPIVHEHDTDPAAPSAEVVDNALIFGNNLATMDQVWFRLNNVPSAPEDKVYQGWLINDDNSFTNIGVLTVNAEGVIDFLWVTPDGINLLNRVKGIQITLEPTTGSGQPTGKVSYAGEFTPEEQQIVRRLFVYNQDEPVTPRDKPYAGGLISEASLAHQHIENAANAAAIGAMQEMRIHLEHTINILEGSQSPRFKDYTQDGRVENPGDGFGVLAYSQIVVLLLGSPEEMIATRDEIIEEMNLIEQKCINTLELRDNTEIIAALEELRALVEHLDHETAAHLYMQTQVALAIEIEPVP